MRSPRRTRRKRHLQAAVAVWLLAAGIAMHAQAQALRIAVKDMMNGSAIPTELDCGIGEQPLPLESRVPGLYENRKLVARNGDVVWIRISPAREYGPREIEVRTRGGVPVSWTFHVARKRASYTYQYLDEGLPYQAKGDFDKALAYYELAYVAAPANRRTQYDVKLKYNYAMALANACLRAQYRTCDAAKRLLGEMKTAAPGDDLYARERITVAELDRTLRDLEVNDVARMYAEFKTLFDGGEYVAAAKAGETLLAQYEANADVLYRASLTRDRLREDVGTAYFRAASGTQRAAPESNAELLAKARAQFVQVEKKPPTVRRALRAVEQRL